jgi:O-antigen ligase
MPIIFKIRKSKKLSRLRMSEWELIDRESIEKRKTALEKRGALKDAERLPREYPPIERKPRPPRISWAKDRALLKFIEVGILALIVWVPLPKGSVNEWSILIMQIVVFAMTAAYVLVEDKPLDNEYLELVLRWPRYLFLAVFALIAFQILPLPNFLVKILSPRSYAFRQMFVPEFSRVHFMSISVMPGHTLRAGLELLTYFLLGFLVVKTTVRRKQIMRIFYFLVGMGVFQAFYGFFELYNPAPRVLFYKKLHYLDCVTGTFVNRNHLSGYLEMAIPLAIGLILARTDFFSLAGERWRKKILLLSEKGAYKNILLALGIILMGLAVIFSKSRSGVFLLVFAFFLLFGMSALYYGRVKREFKWVKDFFKTVFLIILVIAVYIGIDAMIERFAMDKILNTVRPVVWSNTTGIIGDFPVLGSGLGTFQALYPAYEESSTPPLFEHAHNDYLEYLSELGGLGFLLLLGGVLTMLVFAFLVWKVRQHPGVRGLALGGMVAVVVMLLHSITDFNLHIPANMMLFAVVVSLTIATAFYKKNTSG